MNRKTRLLLIAGIIYSLFLPFVALYVGYQIRTIWPPASEEFNLLKEAQRLLDRYYISDLPDQLILERGMIHGMVGKLGDPYTIYLEPAEHELQTDELTGEYGGIGAHLSRGEDRRIHLVPFEDGPAARAGVFEGDILIAVDGELIEEEISLEEVRAMERGPVGTTVTLTIAARSLAEDSLIIDVVRETFSIPSVTGYTLPDQPDIGVIFITLFSEKTPEEVERTYQTLIDRGAVYFVLDLRGNVGGLLDSAVDVARFFLLDGMILIEETRGGGEEQYRVKSPGKASDVPLVVLVDENTASASEVLAAAVQENGRAPVIGTRTFGKGSVQLILELDDGSSLHITSSRWQTPNGNTLDGQGLQPDILVSVEEGDIDVHMQTAISWFLSDT
ncbi:MAG: S41 family peptidase [Anaerolineaceae bacterium]|nr:MAG: S41 family peptidase [Anaerolineaceae bacterium]